MTSHPFVESKPFSSDKNDLMGIAEIKKTFTIGDESSITIFDEYGTIPFEDIDRFVSNHDEGVDIPLCFVMSGFFIALFGSLLYFIKTNETDWRKHNQYLQKLDFDKGTKRIGYNRSNISDEGLFRMKIPDDRSTRSPTTKSLYKHKLNNRMGNISESLSLTSRSRFEPTPNRLSVSYTRLRSQGQMRSVVNFEN